MGRVLQIGRRGKLEEPARLPAGLEGLDTQVALIQALIPLGLQAVEEVLQREVLVLGMPGGTERRIECGGGDSGGGVPAGPEAARVRVPRVRDRRLGVEVPLESYRRLQQRREADEGMLRRVLYGLSSPGLPAGGRGGTGSLRAEPLERFRRYIRATARRLRALQERRLEGYEFVALVLDGRTFAGDTMVIALAVTLGGEKVVLGFVQTGTENATTCEAFLRSGGRGTWKITRPSWSHCGPGTRSRLGSACACTCCACKRTCSVLTPPPFDHGGRK